MLGAAGSEDMGGEVTGGEGTAASAALATRAMFAPVCVDTADGAGTGGALAILAAWVSAVPLSVPVCDAAAAGSERDAVGRLIAALSVSGFAAPAWSDGGAVAADLPASDCARRSARRCDSFSMARSVSFIERCSRGGVNSRLG